MPSKGKRYFNGMNASIWLNDALLAEALSIEYTETKQKMPIHGYKSVTWDSVLLGEVVIQGIISINFEKAFKLKEFIEISPDLDKNMPAIKGKAALSRREINIKIKYERQELEAEQLANTALANNINWQTNKVYNEISDYKVIELRGVTFTNVQQSIAPDSSNVLEHYNFTAREAI